MKEHSANDFVIEQVRAFGEGGYDTNERDDYLSIQMDDPREIIEEIHLTSPFQI